MRAEGARRGAGPSAARRLVARAVAAADDARDDEPEQAEPEHEGDRDRNPNAFAVEEVGNDGDAGGDGEREADETRDGHSVPELEQLLLRTLAEAQPVVCRRRDQERRRDGAQEQREEVNGAVERRQRLELVRERQDEEEREQDLDARERDPELVQQLDQLAVEAFLLGLGHRRRSFTAAEASNALAHP